tara:strand:- start:4 stop:306 length:303 start_codon:yes stop_codon:yes gene_type:complete
MFPRPVLQARERLEQLQSQVLQTRLSRAWRALDLSERLLLPAARMLLLLGMLGLERLVRLRSLVQQMFLSLESKLLVKSAQYRLQALQMFLSRVFRRQER